MSRRTWLRNTLGGSPTVNDFVPLDRILQGESVLTAQIEKPFMIYRFGNRTNEDLSEADTEDVSRQFFLVYIHDVPSDYSQIDEIEMAVIHSLNLANSAPEGIITTRYLETSRDLDDQALGTIFRYVRFQFVIG